ncbi:hypothetical protein EJ05DRAFT_179005 [Pseudovirgaria hyperparasitica]|uniref:Uncharacterized protein n=1 Tax=Pseudovirgaria hyperparasitica TaxID=470096 RepID=A0A6A6WFM3_9PEZI|nr:uncharacterized protein EJ05DRAFT_179005 [Pseudovirgaria hyperparasitica]KAF2761622.1 hypothetical protein EJ05DRAFT_179005 [Pseudovirgaria hyperparasitica]
MDMLNILPDTIKTYLTLLLTTYPSILTPIFHTLHILRTLALPLIARLTTAPDLFSLGVLVIILFASFYLLQMLVSAVLFWVRFAFKAALYVGIAVAALYVYARGLEGTVEDVSAAVGAWMGEGEALRENADRYYAGGPNRRGYVRQANTGWRHRV